MSWLSELIHGRIAKPAKPYVEAVVKTFIELHPELALVISDGEVELAKLKRAIKDKNLIAASEAYSALEAAWNQVTAELKK